MRPRHLLPQQKCSASPTLQVNLSFLELSGPVTMKVFSIGKILLSLTGTPWMILLSTSIPLYLMNQQDLNYQVMVLAPYAYGTAIVTLLAALLFWLTSKLKNPQSLQRTLWGYYFLGFFFSAMTAIHHLDAHIAIKLAMMVIGIAVIVILSMTFEKKVTLSNAVGFWAVLSAAFIVTDLASVYLNLTSRPSPFAEGKQATDVSELIAQHGTAPNVYHFILDEFQTDMFSLTLTQNNRKSFAGFTFFPKATTLFGRTGMSIPATLTGRSYDLQTRQFDYQHSAFNDKPSFVYWLKEKGYETYAYIHPMWPFKLGLFDHTVSHDLSNTNSQAQWNRTFFQLWVFSNLPIHIANQLANKADIEQLRNQNLLSPITPLGSYQTLQLMLDQEENYSATNRYTFAHLILPHFPYILNKDCSYDPDKITASPISQSNCATKLMQDFIKKLKDLGRFDNSLIIFQSDHGARFEIEDRRLVSVEDKGNYSIPWSIARSRSLLLIKRPQDSAEKALEISSYEASLLDLAPTVNQALNLNMSSDFSGVDLFNPLNTSEKRVRYYYFFEKKIDNIGWTDEMTRYRISDSKMALEGTVRLSNNVPGR
jgi:hypothetical protein